MFYIDNEMVKHGLSLDITTPSELFYFLKSILIDGVEIAKPDAVIDDVLIFNSGYNIKAGLNIVEVTDGVKSFNIKLDQIDLNSLKSDKSLLGLNAKNIVLKTPKVRGWDYEESSTHYILHNNGSSFEINKNLSGTDFSVNCKRGITNLSGVGRTKAKDLSVYIIYNDSGFSLIYEYSVGWSGHWGFYSNSGSSVFLEYYRNRSWTSLKDSVLFLDGISKSGIKSDFINTNQSFNDIGGVFSFFPLTGSGFVSDSLLNSSGNLKDSFSDGASIINTNNGDRVIILKNNRYYMGISYDDSLY